MLRGIQTTGKTIRSVAYHPNKFIYTYIKSYSVTTHDLKSQWNKSTIPIQPYTISNRLQNKDIPIPIRQFTTLRNVRKQVKDMNKEEMLFVFTDTKSTRMDVCKAGERLLKEQIHVTEQSMKEIVNRLMLSRFNDLARRLSYFYFTYSGPLHSALAKSLLRVAANLKDRKFFISTASHTLPGLLDITGELTGVYLRSLLSVYGHDEGMQYFLQYKTNNKRYRVILPEMLFGLYENHYYEECISIYKALCDEFGWKHCVHQDSILTPELYNQQKDIKVLCHSRIYAAVIGSELALDNFESAKDLYDEMLFWKLIPLRETYYDFIKFGDTSHAYLQKVKKLPTSLTDVQKQYITSLLKCSQYDSFLPFVEAHDRYRFTRTGIEDSSRHVIERSVRLTPYSYQRLSIYKLLKEMKNRDRSVWYSGCIVLKTDKEVNGLIKLLSQDLQPAIDFKLADLDELRIEISSVYNWLDIREQLEQQLKYMCLLQTYDKLTFSSLFLSIVTTIFTRIVRLNNSVKSFAADCSIRLFNPFTIRNCDLL